MSYWGKPNKKQYPSDKTCICKSDIRKKLPKMMEIFGMTLLTGNCLETIYSGKHFPYKNLSILVQHLLYKIQTDFVKEWRPEGWALGCARSNKRDKKDKFEALCS